MACIRRYTTPTQQLVVEGANLLWADVYVTFVQDKTKLTLTEDRIDKEYDGTDTIITIEFSQEESSAFRQGEVKVEVNWMEDGKRNATNIAIMKITRNLLEEVIEDE